MNLVRLLYVSHLAKGCGPDELKQIVEASRKNNAESGITGALCYSGNGFLQCLEGSRGAVNDLYVRIVGDERHKDVTLVEYSEIENRDFADWSMAYVRTDDVDSGILLRYSADTVFDPFALSSGQALGLLRDIAGERREFLSKHA